MASCKVSGLKLAGEYGVMVASWPLMLTRRAGIGKPAIPCHKGCENKAEESPCHAKS